MPPRKPAPKNVRPVAADNPNTEQLMVRVSPTLLADLDAWIERLNAGAEGPRWNRSDVVRALVARAVREKGATGDAP